MRPATVVDATNGSAPSTPTLFTLPQELQDQIFDFAYTRVGGVTYISRRDWEARESVRKRESGRNRSERKNYVKKLFPYVKVEEFMVSKRFFVAATRAWVGNQHFDNLDHAGHSGGPVGVTFAFARTATLKYPIPHWVASLPRLRSLRYQMSAYVFDHCSDEFAVLEDRLTDAELQQVLEADDLIEIRGLGHFEACPGIDSTDHISEAQRACFLDNIAGFSRYARRQLSQPKAEGQELPSQSRGRCGLHVFDALYLGSDVSATSSTLRSQMPMHFDMPFTEMGGIGIDKQFMDLRSLGFDTHPIEMGDLLSFAGANEKSRLRPCQIPDHPVETWKAGVEPQWISSLHFPLRSEDIPDIGFELRELFIWREVEVIAWIKEAKTLMRAYDDGVKAHTPTDREGTQATAETKLEAATQANGESSRAAISIVQESVAAPITSQLEAASLKQRYNESIKTPALIDRKSTRISVKDQCRTSAVKRAGRDRAKTSKAVSKRRSPYPAESCPEESVDMVRLKKMLLLLGFSSMLLFMYMFTQIK